jgi:hypothetical protein
MNQSPQIKPTLINGDDANPKAVEELTSKREADRWAPESAILGLF